MRFSRTLAVAACATALSIAGCAADKPRRTVSKPAATATAKPAAKQSSSPTAAAAAPVATGPRDERYNQAVLLVKSGKWQEAETAMLAWIKTYPQYSGPQANLGIVYLRTNRKDLAAAAFARAVSLNPRNAIAQTGVGLLAAEAGDFARAEQAYRAAIAADPAYGLAHLNLAILLDRNLNRPDAALREYRLYRDNGGKDDLKAALWIAELEQRAGGASAAPGASAGDDKSFSKTPAAPPKPVASGSGS